MLKDDPPMSRSRVMFEYSNLQQDDQETNGKWKCNRFIARVDQGDPSDRLPVWVGDDGFLCVNVMTGTFLRSKMKIKIMLIHRLDGCRSEVDWSSSGVACDHLTNNEDLAQLLSVYC
ncbi:hypothetical protein NPIL_121221 [Nephila pilipes]|uniref:Uncharacterized protein n=1 Tax=Nephila pilipes TaxID=299642 RepID=A0A8X6PI63_NEPPI|nr:hypothetical protein NPIL_121221 [Nephila pilipes]